MNNFIKNYYNLISKNIQLKYFNNINNFSNRYFVLTNSLLATDNIFCKLNS